MNKSILARSDEAPYFWEKGCPDELDDAVPCLCGGEALFHVAKDDRDTPHLFCSSNPRCGRIVSAQFRTVEEAVTEWNRQVRIDSCQAHSWMRQPDEMPCSPGKYVCAHCQAVLGKDVLP